MALKLELDWASEVTPDERMREAGWLDEPTPVTVEYDEKSGPAGWPTVVVRVEGESGAVTGPWLFAWLVDVYGEDSDGASELASLAVEE